MSQVAFHFNASDKTRYACRLLRKAAGQGAKVVVTGDADDLDRLDHALWTFGAVEFLPHCRGDASSAMIQASPVILSVLGVSVPPASVLLHMGGPTVSDIGTFEKVIEIVGQSEGDRQEARLRWKKYAALGHQMVHHDVALAGRADE